ncbi:unnamed protein product [Caenorhabditis sp. 36 PRJEB53466]|nr:unnamed protein product [Caenorhabditis sp. 36 PRJEB53466]
MSFNAEPVLNQLGEPEGNLLPKLKLAIQAKIREKEAARAVVDFFRLRLRNRLEAMGDRPFRLILDVLERELARAEQDLSRRETELRDMQIMEQVMEQMNRVHI